MNVCARRLLAAAETRRTRTHAADRTHTRAEAIANSNRASVRTKKRIWRVGSKSRHANFDANANAKAAERRHRQNGTNYGDRRQRRGEYKSVQQTIEPSSRQDGAARSIIKLRERMFASISLAGIAVFIRRLSPCRACAATAAAGIDILLAVQPRYCFS